jgi:hypothetical protein
VQKEISEKQKKQAGDMSRRDFLKDAVLEINIPTINMIYMQA